MQILSTPHSYTFFPDTSRSSYAILTRFRAMTCAVLSSILILCASVASLRTSLNRFIVFTIYLLLVVRGYAHSSTLHPRHVIPGAVPWLNGSQQSTQVGANCFAETTGPQWTISSRSVDGECTRALRGCDGTCIVQKQFKRRNTLRVDKHLLEQLIPPCPVSNTPPTYLVSASLGSGAEPLLVLDDLPLPAARWLYGSRARGAAGAWCTWPLAAVLAGARSRRPDMSWLWLRLSGPHLLSWSKDSLQSGHILVRLWLPCLCRGQHQKGAAPQAAPQWGHQAH